MKHLYPILFILLGVGVSASAQPSLTLPACQALALQRSPELRTFPAVLRAQDGWIEQAGLGLNPEFELEMENFLGTGELQGVDGLETTVGLSQTIETAQKRQKRQAIAEREKDGVSQAYATARLQVLYAVSTAYTDLLAALAQETIQASFHTLSQEIHQTLLASVEAGRESPLEAKRAQIMVSRTEADLRRAQGETEKARLQLAQHWAETSPTFSAIEGNLYDFSLVDSSLASVVIPATHPQLAQAQAQIEAEQARLALERAKARPDITLSGGIRYLADADDAAFVAGISIPFPTRDKNQGAIRATEAAVEQAAQQQEAEMQKLQQALQIARHSLRQAYTEVRQFETAILPLTEQTLESTQEGYRQGKFPYLNVLDAQRAYFEAKEQHIAAALAVQNAVNEIQFLTAAYPILQTQTLEETVQ